MEIRWEMSGVPEHDLLIALAGVAALGASSMTFAQTTGADALANTQELISQRQADKRSIMLDTLALRPEQLAKFVPICDEFQAEMKKLWTDATNLRSRLFVADSVAATHIAGCAPQPRGL